MSVVELYDNGGPKLTLPDPDQLDTQAPTKLQAHTNQLDT